MAVPQFSDVQKTAAKFARNYVPALATSRDSPKTKSLKINDLNKFQRLAPKAGFGYGPRLSPARG
ncbi:MAG: hypothetical protein WBC85_14900, partial [Planktotalea sp.]|uniref:hypothetical protein n=1 Tax=Planktotalea sp. TaxID=2029877 RepID=UPI003C75BC1A